MNKDETKIVLAGEGGQGIQTMAKALNEAAISSGYESTYIPSFGVEQRGAPSMAFVIISKNKIMYPKFSHSDIAVILRERAINEVEKFITPNTKLVFDSSTIDSKKLPKCSIHKMGVSATKVADEKNINRSYNVLMFGSIVQLLKLDQEAGWKAIHNTLKDKIDSKEKKKKNEDIYEFGYHVVFEQKHFSEPSYHSKTETFIYKNKERIGKVDPKLCKGCRICILKCPTKSLSDSKDLGAFGLPIPKIDISTCIACDNCRRFCPDGAIAVEKNK